MKAELRKSIKDYKNARKEHIELVCEELILYAGFNCEVVGNEIHLDTIAKPIKYVCSEKNVMGDVYRFLSHYGGVFNSHFLSLKIKEHNDNFNINH